MKQDAAFFEGSEPILIYIAKRLREAIRLESLLTAANLDYAVEADQYSGGIIFRSQRVGAFFYVLPEILDAAHGVLRTNGYRPQPLEDPIR
jgi:hypothetical protein